MNRERAKELLPIIQAYAEGKPIEVRDASVESDWYATARPGWDDSNEYRIKPELLTPKYRPFNAEELPLLVGYVVRNKTSSAVGMVDYYNPNHGVVGINSYYLGAEELLDNWVIQTVDETNPLVSGLYAVTERPCGVLDVA